MARYLARACPRCNGYVGIVMREPGHSVRFQDVIGRCTRCRYRMVWIVIRGKAIANGQGTQYKPQLIRKNVLKAHGPEQYRSEV